MIYASDLWQPLVLMAHHENLSQLYGPRARPPDGQDYAGDIMMLREMIRPKFLRS